MFKVDCFCDDKNIARLLHSLNGIALDLKAIPVVNAKVGRNGKMVAKSQGDCVSLLAQYIKENKMATLKAPDVKEFAIAHGKAPGGYSLTLKKATKAGLLKKAGKGTKTGYHVVPAVLAQLLSGAK